LKLAGIDIGSNAMRLLIGEVVEFNDKIHISKLSLIRLPIRLGSDVFDHGEISIQKEKDFINGMSAFKTIMDIHKVEGYRACATSAMRGANNGPSIVEKTRKETGISIEIIDGDTEAEIILSTFHLLSLEEHTPYLYIDVGGGSTEISLLLNGKSAASHSFKIGTVRILGNNVKDEEWSSMLAWVKELKREFHPKKAIGSGGNINKIIKLCCNDNENIMDVSLMKALLNEMEAMSVKERMLQWDLRSDRADVIVPASNIYLKVLEKAGISTIIIPKIGLADGLLYKQYSSAKQFLK